MNSIQEQVDNNQTSAIKLRRAAVEWYRQNGRDFSWRRTRDPYKILVAEICLQKTNADKVALVFDHFIERYPNINSLMKADPDDLSKYFINLGLLKRSEFLLNIAEAIIHDHKGRIPKQRQTLLAIRGIGDYTANAVLCLAYGKRLPLLDGSTQRLLQRVFNIHTEKPAWANKQMRVFMETILPKQNARDFNLAIIDIAAAYCRPKNPKCIQCPIQSLCYTGKHDLEEQRLA